MTQLQAGVDHPNAQHVQKAASPPNTRNISSLIALVSKVEGVPKLRPKGLWPLCTWRFLQPPFRFESRGGGLRGFLGGSAGMANGVVNGIAIAFLLEEWRTFQDSNAAHGLYSRSRIRYHHIPNTRAGVRSRAPPGNLRCSMRAKTSKRPAWPLTASATSRPAMPAMATP